MTNKMTNDLLKFDNGDIVLVANAGGGIVHRGHVDRFGKLAANCGKAAPKHGFGTYDADCSMDVVNAENKRRCVNC